ncbi:MAG: hypothetical protein N2654_07925, partial [Deltaproteobacteria bacterium]|nr:hypothetical protein [Deltaproteobacteria bacterium]
KIPFSPLRSSENSGQFLVRPLYDKAEVLTILNRKNSKGLGWGTTDKDVYLLNLFLARTVSATAQVDEHYRDFIFRQPSTTVFYLFVDCVFGVLDKCLASAFNNFTRQIDVYMIEGGSRDTRVKNFHGQSPGSQFPELLALMKDFSIETSRFGEKYSRLLTEVVTTYGCSGDADILGIELSPRMTGFLEDTQASTGPTLNDFLTPSEFAGVLNRFLDLFEEYKSKMESLSSQVVRATSGKVSGLNLKPVEQTIQMIKLLSNLVRASSTEESKSFESSEKRISEFFFKVLLQSNTYLSYAWRMRQLFDQDSLDFTSFPEFLNIVLLNINLLYGVRDLFGLVHQNRAKQINILKSCLTRKCDPSSFSKMFDDEMYKQLASSSLSGVSTAMSLYTD